MAIVNAEHPITLNDAESYQPGPAKKWSIGMTKEGRLIMKKKLDRDYTLTKIEFDVTSGYFLSAITPALIRVWQTGFESDARYLLLNQAVEDETHYEQEISLAITDREGEREVVVDAWADTLWSGWGNYGSWSSVYSFNTATTFIGGHINAQPFKGDLQIIGRPLHEVPNS